MFFLQFGMDECNCTIPCDFHEYEVSMSYAKYPGKQIADVYEVVHVIVLLWSYNFFDL